MTARWRANAKKYIEQTVTLIDQGDWRSFFEEQQTEHYGHINIPTSYHILEWLRTAGIEWDEDVRQEVLFENINELLEDCNSGGMLSLEELYLWDDDRWSDGATGWLGYDQEEFYNLIKTNPNKLTSATLDDDILTIK